MKTTVALAVLVICVTACNAIFWKDCGSKGSKVKTVKVTGCEKTKVCNLPRGTNVTFTVDFHTNAAAESAKSVVHGVIDHIPLPFPVKNPDACHDKEAGLTCPLKSDKAYTYTPKIYIMNAYPKVKAVVKWELQNSEGVDIFCVLVPTQIVDGLTNDSDSNRTKLRSNNIRTKHRSNNIHPRLLQVL